MAESNLKPCPFCGNAHVRLTNWGLYRAWCPVCKAQSADEISEKAAVAAWNRRADNGETD